MTNRIKSPLVGNGHGSNREEEIYQKLHSEYIAVHNNESEASNQIIHTVAQLVVQRDIYHNDIVTTGIRETFYNGSKKSDRANPSLEQYHKTSGRIDGLLRTLGLTPNLDGENDSGGDDFDQV